MKAFSEDSNKDKILLYNDKITMYNYKYVQEVQSI